MTTAAAKPLIILADDDVELLKAMQFRLQQWGYRIKCVPDKARLLELLSVEEPILLLLDLFFGRARWCRVAARFVAATAGSDGRAVYRPRLDRQCGYRHQAWSLRLSHQTDRSESVARGHRTCR